MPAKSARGHARGRDARRSGRWASATPLAIATLMLMGCKEKAEPKDARPAEEAQMLGAGTDPVPIGRIAAAPDYQMSVESVEDCSLRPPFAAKRGHQKIAVEVVIEGTTSREVPVNLFYATLESADGDSWEATPAGCKPVLEARRVVQGEKARGLLTFEVPAGARRLRLFYAPTVIGGGREELRFDLGR